MKIGIPKEIHAGETRVAVIPQMISTFTKSQHEVFVEAGAGAGASFSDEEYEKGGATIIPNPADLYNTADILVKVQPPAMHPVTKTHEVLMMREGAVLIGYLAPSTNREAIEKLVERKIIAFAMEFIPRITRAQSMDALSSMATIAGYKAVLIAANNLPKIFPLLMTAAGSIPAANVLVLGAGVAGLQAIATAKRLGAKVQAFDPRPAVKEQVESLGAKFVEMEQLEDVETEGGYAKEQSDEFLRREQQVIGERLPRMDVVITTAQIFGKRAPILITEDMVQLMPKGSIIIDLAAEQGGNCELTEAGKMTEKYGVRIYGAVNLPAQVPVHASQMYSKNVTNLFKHLYQAEDGALDFEDEITKGACITRNGEIVNEIVKNIIQTGGSQ
ncbi:MAG: Re/Si-specific NAD(P)(+) transhydrogenase subunit alpha [Chlorobi bacterium]|nr:Re/Si-specific NAD(P)(+) transhydrogenase subunit alpha [Chlorobiota bacterium]